MKADDRPGRSGLLHLADCTYDVNSETLLGPDKRPVSLRNQSSKVLRCLAGRPNEVVSKDAIVSTVWTQTFVSDDSLTQCIKDIRRAIGDVDQTVIKTAIGRGYELVIQDFPVSEISAVPLTFVDKIRVRSQLPDVLDLADDIFENILTALSSRKGTKVTTDPEEIVLADYLIEGNVRQSGNHLKAFISITDRAGEGQFFTERFECQFNDISEFANVVAQKVTNVLRVSGIANYGKRFLTVRNSKLDPQQLLSKAAYHYAKITPEATQAARDTLQVVVERTPDDPMALAMLAATTVHLCPHIPHAFLSREKSWAFDLANRAIYLAPEVDYVFRTRGNLKFWLDGDHEGAVEDCLRALEITPLFQLAHLTLAEIELMSGTPAAARQRIQTMLTVEPYLPQYPFFLTLISLSHILEGNREEGQKFAFEAFARAPWQSWNRLVLLTACGDDEVPNSDKLDDAAREIDLPLDHFTTLPFRDKAGLTLLKSRLQKAMRRYSR